MIVTRSWIQYLDNIPKMSAFCWKSFFFFFFKHNVIVQFISWQFNWHLKFSKIFFAIWYTLSDIQSCTSIFCSWWKRMINKNEVNNVQLLIITILLIVSSSFIVYFNSSLFIVNTWANHSCWWREFSKFLFFILF